MNAKHEGGPAIRRFALALVVALVHGQAISAPTDIATSPLITPGTSNVKPNILFILDNSGSMDWQYLPDWVNDNHCKDTGTGTSAACSSGSPPYMSPNINGVYYNPEITYSPPVKFDGNSYTNYTTYTSVKQDGFGIQSTSNTNLTTSYPDVEYCTDSSYTECLRNDNYLLPGNVSGNSYTYAHATTASQSGTAKYASGSVHAPTASLARTTGPYYYVIVPGEYCDTKKLANCTTANQPTGSFIYPGAIRWCQDANLASCQATRTEAKWCYDTGLTNCTSSIRWCAAARTATSGSSGCQASYDASHTFSTIPSTTVLWCTSAALTSCQASQDASHRYPTAGYSRPRYPTVVISGGSSGAQGTITVSGVSSSAAFSVTAATVGGYGNLLAASISCGSGISACNTNSTSQSTRNSRVCAAIASAIDSNSGTTGFGSSSCVNVGGTNDYRLTITSPVGTTYNGASLTASRTLTSGSATLTAAAFNSAGGDTIVAVPGSWKRIDIVPGSTYGNLYTQATGAVSAAVTSAVVVDRTSRTDCAARPTCSYTEEMTNFANWYAYYRSRMQMMKTALTQAFAGVDDRYRVGYFAINYNYPSDYSAHISPNPKISQTITGSSPERYSSTDFLDIANFDATQREYWYTTLVKAKPDNGTPLRYALSKAGRIFAHLESSGGTTANDPVQYSCQKNFTILSTDGYWNGAAGYKLDGGSIGNQDGTLTRPELDGNNQSSTLADVAAYYYNTDLRTSGLSNCSGALGGDVCNNNVPTTTLDRKTTQHMATYTIGLGVDGLMQYRSNYATNPANAADQPDDYEAVANGTGANPTGGVCAWQASGSCNWPIPGDSRQENIDDLWHAAVNGHGNYLSARNPMDLNQGLRNLLATLSTQTGGAAAATTSNPNVTTGDNFVFSSNYVTTEWVGDLVSQTMNTTTGDINVGQNWSAQAQLDGKAWSARSIYTFDAAAGNRRKDFAWTTLNSAVAGQCNPPLSEQGCFSSTYIDASLAQFCTLGAICLSSSQKASASGQKLVEFLRGSREHEETATEAVDRWYRTRTHVLGDIVSAEAVYAGRYLYDYGSATGYPARNTPRANPSVFVAANDGMLHAFDASSGNERWAYVPSMSFRNMHKLADFEYPSKHIFMVDGTPVMGDVSSGGSWRTILVGGLAAGGPGYYALDITDQTNPTVLWEFRAGQVQADGHVEACALTTSPRYTSLSGVTTDCDLGYSYGNPVITKVGGTWVVMVTSGYNNHQSGGDGKGYLYILNATTGTVISKTSTGAGNTTTPSGFGRIAAWADNALQDNTAKYVYGGDMLGNMWAFDLTGGGAPSVKLLINVGSSKPITAKPQLGEVIKNNGVAKRVVFFPTGRLLGSTDLADTSQQSFYGVWDKDGGGAPTNLVPSNVTAGGDGRVGSVLPNVFEDDANLGWRLDFPDPGERGNTDPSLVFGTLVFSTNRPSTADACNPSGFESWVYNVDYRSGGVVEQPGSTNTHIAVNYHGAATRPNVVGLPGGTVISITRVSGGGGGGGVQNQVGEVRLGSESGLTRRVSWRELLN